MPAKMGNMSLKDKINDLKRVFIQKLPDHLSRVEKEYGKLSAVDTPNNDGVLQALFLQLHSLKGGASTFGLMALFETVKEIEKDVSSLIELRRSKPEALDFTTVRSSLDKQILNLAAAIKQAQAQKTVLKTELPIAQEAFEPETESGQNKLIYICDDVPETVAHLRIQLKYLGYTVRPFTNTNKLLEAVLDELPAAMVMDIMFPSGEFSGPDVIRRLRKKVDHLPPVVFISKRRDYASRCAAIQAGGSAYYVKPIKAFDLVQTLDALTTTQKRSPNKILVVDDDPEIAKFHSAILNEAKMTTQELYNPEKILGALASFKPDLVLMDMHMPQCSGIDIAKIIRQIPEYISLPIIYLSGEKDLEKQANALSAGAEGFLTKPVHPVTLINEVNVRVQRMHDLEALMVRDSLTGLFNHTFMQRYLEKAMANSRRTQKGCCVVMVDIDKFKVINDTYGHQKGDEVIITISRLLRQKVRESDAVGRYGGEEFIMVLNQTTKEQAFRIVDKIRNDFSKLKFEHDEHIFQCSFSAGVSQAMEHQTAAELLECSDQALYQSKNNGRNQVTLAP